ncbi:hypothetical protein CABS01_17274 [Colletotrichum abscissum]|nr:hypothetical protein CABS01_17274 [Colletotrichum abscissum]
MRSSDRRILTISYSTEFIIQCLFVLR